jgi:hypothetical protein
MTAAGDVLQDSGPKLSLPGPCYHLLPPHSSRPHLEEVVEFEDLVLLRSWKIPGLSLSHLFWLQLSSVSAFLAAQPTNRCKSASSSRKELRGVRRAAKLRTRTRFFAAASFSAFAVSSASAMVLNVNWVPILLVNKKSKYVNGKVASGTAASSWSGFDASF